ncbi:MAG: hypothetical protein AVDCRST_MAG93-3951 [uncultured Chloroflexia bacterium]|uniref:Uncharacterized protein n=1 Tax=uncultured Chloroflexia bacterium TaxID=1672391 RepID=A0A6J4JZC0_9CHLR|nr:MAG: hypothetical protein AVDCRST_MAG93-3951 [uncultured Chloroflexia bacterium]
MRYHPQTLGEARLVARTLDFETKHGDLGVNRCPKCREAVFAVERRSPDGTVDYGYCLNPGCRYEPVEGLVQPGTLERRVVGGNWL